MLLSVPPGRADPLPVLPHQMRPDPMGALSEARIIAIVRSQDPGVKAARATARVSEGQRLRVRPYPNPRVIWNRESFADNGGSGGSEDNLALMVPVDLSSRRKTQDRLYGAQAARGHAQAVRALGQATASALARFYEAIAARERVHIEDRIEKRLADGAEVLTKRKQAGTASGYEVMRIQLALEFARSTLRTARADALSRARALFALLALDPETPLAGSLAVDPEWSARAHAVDAGTETLPPPSVSLMRAAQAVAAEARDAADNAWIPQASIMAGPRFGTEGGSRYGYVAGVSLELPLFARGQGLQQQAAALGQQASSQADALSRTARVDAARAAIALSATQGERIRFEAATHDLLARLQRAAESGYHAGERSVVELLDAGRAQARVQRRLLELALAAKLAEVALRAASGEFEQAAPATVRGPHPLSRRPMGGGP